MEFCERHGSGSQPGGGICAVCLQEKLILLWRGEGQNANWDTEEFCVTPPPVLEEEDQERPSLREDDDDDEAGPRVGTSSSFACFPIRFRVKNDDRKNDDHEREKIDRSQFSCELKSILKELAALHDKKKRRTGTESGSLSARRPPHYDEVSHVSPSCHDPSQKGFQISSLYQLVESCNELLFMLVASMGHG